MYRLCWLLAIFVLAVTGQLSLAQEGAWVDGPYFNDIGPCEQYVTFYLQDFTPNSEVRVTSNYSEVLCSGEQVSSSWTTIVGTTDSNGDFAWTARHVGKGIYHYTFSVYNSAVSNSTARQVDFGTTQSLPQPPDPVAPIPPQSSYDAGMSGLGDGCRDNGDGTVTCVALRVEHSCRVCADPYIGIFELPKGASPNIILVRFDGRHGATRTGGGHCGSEGDSREGFEYIRGCVEKIETAIGQGRDQPSRWTLTYAK